MPFAFCIASLSCAVIIAFYKLGDARLASTAMIAMTTSSSMRVTAAQGKQLPRRFRGELVEVFIPPTNHSDVTDLLPRGSRFDILQSTRGSSRRSLWDARRSIFQSPAPEKNRRIQFPSTAVETAPHASRVKCAQP